MRTQREVPRALYHDNDLVIQSIAMENDEESILDYFPSSNFGPCCTSGCQDCRPNCHAQTNGANYF